LGSPDIVGFDTGAATGALLVLLVWHGSAVAAGAVAGGVGTALAVYLLAMRRGVRGHRLILVGIGIAAMLSSVNAFLLTRADVTDAQSAATWLTGSLNGREWTDIRPILVALPILLPLALWLGRDLRMLELGDDTARALGVGAERTRLAAIVVGVGMTAVATACAGPVTFVALAAPQIGRRLTTSTGPTVLPAALTGAALLAGADLAARRLLLPVGVLTGVLGGVYLAFLLRRAA
jgi:iron complex transport system permease protein